MANLSQEELAARMDVDQAYISKLEAGLRNPTITTIERLASSLDVSIDALFSAEVVKSR